MPAKLDLSVLRKRKAPIAPADRQDDFDPMQKRVVPLRHDTPRANARYVLYWMQMHRRAYQNQALNFHNYVRMLWGKKIIEWSKTPQEALETMIRLHHRYALDGRNPNTYTGILWCFGKHDRAWGPQRQVFGLVRYMTSDSTRRKINLPAYKAWVESCEWKNYERDGYPRRSIR